MNVLVTIAGIATGFCLWQTVFGWLGLLFIKLKARKLGHYLCAMSLASIPF